MSLMSTLCSLPSHEVILSAHIIKMIGREL